MAAELNVGGKREPTSMDTRIVALFACHGCAYFLEKIVDGQAHGLRNSMAASEENEVIIPGG
jgi:hypothetical protein